MAQDETQAADDLLDIPPETGPGIAQEARKKGFSAMTKLATLGGVGLLLITGATLWSVSAPPPASQTARVPQMDATPGGRVQAESPNFQETMRKANDEIAERARAAGVNYVPTPEVVLQPVSGGESIVRTPGQELAKPASEVEAPAAAPARRITPDTPTVGPERRIEVRPNPVGTAQDEPQRTDPRGTGTAAPSTQTPEQENRLRQAMINQMGTLTRSLQPPPSTTAQVATPSDADKAAASGGSAAGSGERAPEAPKALLFRPGDLVYAETLLTVTSDGKTPVLAEVVAGPMKGARMIGNFEVLTGANKLVVSFSSMTAPDGRVYEISGLAVDARSAETAVASDVERRLVARYAPILGAAFITGYAASAATPASQSDGGAVAQAAPNARQSLFAGVAAVGSQVSSDLLANAPKGPKISLRAGYPIAIMFIDSVAE